MTHSPPRLRFTLHHRIRELLDQPYLYVALPKHKWEADLHDFAKSWSIEADANYAQLNEHCTGAPDGARYDEFELLKWFDFSAIFPSDFAVPGSWRIRNSHVS